jgi:glycosyltransferase involved in cell wall biosynthesis
MNVAIFTDNDFEKVNGVTTTLKAVLTHAPPGIRVRIYTASRRAADEPHYFSARAVGLPIPFYREMSLYLPQLSKLRRAVLSTGVDVIHLTTPGPLGLAAIRLAHRLRVPLVGSFHTDLGAYTHLLSGSARLGDLMRVFLRWPYGRCARVLAPSEATRRMLVRHPADDARIAIWCRGVDAIRFSPAHRRADLRQQWGVSTERPALLYVGRVSKEKGLHLLPALASALTRRGVPHRFIVVGRGPMEAELQAQLPDAVFTGVLDGDKLASAYASSDVFIFPSRTDTAGNVVLEAQASGLPVLVTNVGGPPENVADGRSGHVVTDMSPDSWLHRVAPLLEHAAYREAMGAAARRYAGTRTWAAALEPLFRTYRELATPAVRPAHQRGDGRAAHVDCGVRSAPGPMAR